MEKVGGGFQKLEYLKEVKSIKSEIEIFFSFHFYFLILILSFAW